MIEDTQLNALDQRITRVEAHYESLSGALTEGFGEIKQMIRSNQVSVRQEMDSLLHRIDSKTKPQTNILLQIIGIGITMSLIAGGLVSSRMNSMESRNQRDHDKIQSRHEWLEAEVLHHQGDGHPHVVLQKVTENKDRIQRLSDRVEDRLMKRYSENDSAQDERIRALERVTFGED